MDDAHRDSITRLSSFFGVSGARAWLEEKPVPFQLTNTVSLTVFDSGWVFHDDAGGAVAIANTASPVWVSKDFLERFISTNGVRSQTNEPRLTRWFSSEGVKTVYLRVADVQCGGCARVTRAAGEIETSGIPTRYNEGARGFAELVTEQEHGFDFLSKRHGEVLVISTTGETSRKGFHFALGELRIRLPADVELNIQNRGNGLPDLNLP